MSRLDSFIRRLEAQRACINAAAAPGAVPEGPVFELGLGNGRTYDHMREKFAGRDIFVFERRVAAHRDCVPDTAHLLLGDIDETLPRAARLHRGRVAFMHYDLGSDDASANAALAARLAPLLDEALAAGGAVASDQALPVPGWVAEPLPAGIAPGRYFLYRKPRR
jgi:hypothetical protein